MRELVASFGSFCLAKTLYTTQQVAKVLGAPSSLVNAKNPPGPGPDAKKPPTMTGQLLSQHQEDRGKVRRSGCSCVYRG